MTGFLSDKQDAAHLARVLMRATCIYTANNIVLRSDRRAYLKAFRQCYYLCSRDVVGNDLLIARKKMIRLKRTTDKSLDKRFEIFSDTKGYYMLAINQCIHIMNSMVIRFIGYRASDQMRVAIYLNNLDQEETLYNLTR